MQQEYPEAKLIGFFYDPNIHPYSEYYLRLLDVKRSCDILGIELSEGEYDYLGWIEATRWLENEPEKGARCSVCFDRRFEVSAKEAQKIGATHFTSTLLTSPKKSIEQLKKSGDMLANKFNIEFLAPDFRQKNGTQEQNIIAKEAKLYRQNYCGCLYALKQQREVQNRLLDELFCPIIKQIQPASIEDRVALYEKRVTLEEQNIAYEIVKKRILNWRLLFGKIIHKKKVQEAHIVPMSVIKNNFSRGKIEKEINSVYYFSRDEIKFITLEKYNSILDTNYQTISEIYKNPPTFKEELKLREKITNSSFDLSAIIVLKEPPNGKFELYLEAKTYQDVQDELIILTQ
jgi:predicted adenine nucleotide alpha hydrolase (AANH) superfamily ATPase